MKTMTWLGVGTAGGAVLKGHNLGEVENRRSRDLITSRSYIWSRQKPVSQTKTGEGALVLSPFKAKNVFVCLFLCVRIGVFMSWHECLFFCVHVCVGVCGCTRARAQAWVEDNLHVMLWHECSFFCVHMCVCVFVCSC